MGKSKYYFSGQKSNTIWLKLSLAFYRLMTSLKSSQALSTLDNLALSTTEHIIIQCTGELGIELIGLITPYLFYKATWCSVSYSW